MLDLNIDLTESASSSLGVSVKGKTSTGGETIQDLGIFIKTIIPGGAAHIDGNLAVNDQLVEVNAESLVNLSNAEAMEKLRKAMGKDMVGRTSIFLKVVRHNGNPIRGKG